MLKATARWIWTSFVVVTIVAAFGVSLLRLLMPLVGEYRSDIALWLEKAMGQPVQIGGLEAVWSGLYPRLQLTDVSLLDATDRQPILTFKQVRVAIDWTALITDGRIEPGSLGLVGIELLVERGADGTVRVAGIATGAGAAAAGTASGSAVRQWFLSRSSLSIEKALVRWRDTAANKPEQAFRDIDISLRNDGDHHQLLAEGNLPASMGEVLRVAIDVHGDPLEATGWSGRVYVAGSGLRPAEWLIPAHWRDVRVQRGSVDLEIWGRWHDGRLIDGDGEIRASGLKIERGVTALALAGLSGRFQWRRESSGWRLLIDQFVLSNQGHAWPQTKLGVHYTETDGQTRVDAAASYALLEDVGGILDQVGMLPPAWRTEWQNLAPRGTLRDVYVRWQREADGDRFYVRGDLRDGAWRARGKAPGVTGFDATIYAQNDAAFVALAARDVSVDFPYLFRDPIGLNDLDGWIAVERQDQGWRVWSDGLALGNRDLRMELSLGLDIPDGDQEPVLDLVGRFHDGRGAAKSAYLPVGAMAQPLVHWLDTAIVSGRVPSGGVVVRGPVHHFPFIDGNGRFEVNFTVEDGVLDFAPGWPRIAGINANVAFNEASMRVVASAGQIFGTSLKDVVAEISDLHAPDRALTVSGQGRGPLDDGLRYLRESPLQSSIGAYFSETKASGRSDLQLDLRVPLNGADHHVGIKGSIRFADNGLVFQNAGVDITQIAGALDFTESSVTADALSAVVDGQPARLRVSGGKGGVLVGAEGETRLDALRQRIPLAVLGWLRGETRWSGELRLRHEGENAAASAPSELLISSALEGVAIALPAPLGKAAAESRPLQLTLPLPIAGGTPLRVRYGDELQGALLLSREGGALALQRGELRFNDGPASVPAAAGLRIAGTLRRFDPAEWANVESQPAAGGASTMAVISGVDVRVEEARILGRTFTGLQVVGQPDDAAWTLRLASERLSGRLRWPQQAGAPVVVELDRLVLDSLPEGPPPSEPATDPRGLPALRFSCADLTYDRRRLGGLDLTVVKIPEGLRLVEGLLRQPTGEVKATGSWTIDRGMQASSLDVTISSSNFGEMLAAFGYAEAFREGKAAGAALLSWRGSPAQYAPGRVSGQVKLKVEDGRILEVNPGAGRIFGLFSLQALPRRLTLDFSDVFAKGFSFDKLDSKFVVVDGRATIERLLVEGPPALIEAKGDVDLAARTYDQTVKVIPNISGSLPLVVAVGAAVSATNPITGAAVWLVERLLRKPLTSVTQVTYKISGPWEDPQVQQISRIDAPAEKPSTPAGAAPR